MVTLSNPEAPATHKQLWLLHILTKTDTRELNLTMQQASDKINELKNGDNGKRPLVNPHASTIKQDKQLRAQQAHDKVNPIPERVIIQGDSPQGITDMFAINKDFMANAYQQGQEFSNNDTATIDFYDFNCKECLFGKTGICQPNWQRSSFTTCQGIVESVSFSCNNFESVKHSIYDYCHRPKGKQCHRRKVDNACLECNYRRSIFRDGHNHSAWAMYIPTIPERIERQEYWLKQFTERDNTEGLEQANTILELLNKLDSN